MKLTEMIKSANKQLNSKEAKKFKKAFKKWANNYSLESQDFDFMKGGKI